MMGLGTVCESKTYASHFHPKRINGADSASLTSISLMGRHVYIVKMMPPSVSSEEVMRETQSHLRDHQPQQSGTRTYVRKELGGHREETRTFFDLDRWVARNTMLSCSLKGNFQIGSLL